MVIGRGSPRLVISPSLWTDNNRDCPLSGKPGRASKKGFFMTRNVNVLWRVIGMAAAIALVGFVAASCDNGVSVAVYHTVSFDTGAGGSQVQPARVRTGQTATRPAANPTRASYNFVNWYASATGGNPFNFAVPITADVTVFARWTAVTVGGDCEYAGCECSTCTGATCGCEDENGPADRTALGGAIDAANALLGATEISVNGSGLADTTYWTSQAVRDIFVSAVATAQDVHDNTDATQAEIDTAAEALAGAQATFNTARRRGQRMAAVNIDNGITMGMVWIAPGAFTMGQNDLMDEFGDWMGSTEHQVTLTRGFYMGVHVVTQEQFQAVMGHNPSHFSGSPATGETQERRPVENVNWYHAIAFANRLSISQGLEPVYYISGIDWETLEFVNIPTTNSDAWNAVVPNWNANGFRLATEAEWEFAARAGTTTEWSFGDDPADLRYYAWYANNSNGMTREVGERKPNPWGLYDMHGNVWEWVWDRFDSFTADPATDPTGAVSGDVREFRGGSWSLPSEYARSALRSGAPPHHWDSFLGFRVVRP